MDSLRYRSATAGLAWPALPEPRAAAILALLFQFERSQWFAPAELQRLQATQLSALLDHARRTVPFYRDRLAHLAPERGMDAAAWRAIPRLTRADIQAAGDQLASTEIPAEHGAVTEIFTSGSTGTPIRSLRTKAWELYWSAFTVRDHLWHRRDLTGKLAAIRDTTKGKALYPHGATTPSWGPSSGRVFETGPTASLNATSPVAEQAEWLQRQDADYLLTHPSIAHRLAQHCLDHGIRLPRLREVETISEILRPETRALCRAAWNVPVTDLYTAREAGYIAIQCPDHEHYHIQSEGIVVEVLDDRGLPCAPGQVGRVVVTPLHNFAMPLIRYDIGDYAEPGGPCPCGRGLPVIARILGRQQNMLLLPDGTERWPLLSSSNIAALLALAPIRQYQFVQTSPHEIRLRLKVARPLSAEEEADLGRWVTEKFGYPFRLAFDYCDEIPPSPSGKFEDFICDLGRQPRPGRAGEGQS